MKTKLFYFVLLAFSFCMSSCEKEPLMNELTNEKATIEIRDGEDQNKPKMTLEPIIYAEIITILRYESDGNLQITTIDTISWGPGIYHELSVYLDSLKNRFFDPNGYITFATWTYPAYVVEEFPLGANTPTYHGPMRLEEAEPIMNSNPFIYLAEEAYVVYTLKKETNNNMDLPMDYWVPDSEVFGPASREACLEYIEQNGELHE